MSIKDFQAFSQEIKEILKYQISFVKCLIPQIQRTTDKKTSWTQKKLMFGGSCYDLSLWRLNKTTSFPTAKPFYMFCSVWFWKEKSHLSLTIWFRIRHLSKSKMQTGHIHMHIVFYCMLSHHVKKPLKINYPVFY